MGNNSNGLEAIHMKSLMKNMAVFCPCPENLLENNLKSNGLISLVQEISRLHNVESLAWLLLISLMQAYSEQKQAA